MSDKLSSDQALEVRNLYGHLISNLYSISLGAEPGAQQIFYDYCVKYLKELSEFEKYSDFKSESKMPIEIGLKYNPEIEHLSTQLETPSTFSLSEFYTKSFQRFFSTYKEWVNGVHMYDRHDADEIMLNEIIVEMEQMRL